MKTYKNVEDEVLLEDKIFLDLEIKTNTNIGRLILSTIISFISKIFQSIFILACSVVVIGVLYEMLNTITDAMIIICLGITCGYIISSWIDWIITRIYVIKINKHIIGKVHLLGIDDYRLQNFIQYNLGAFVTSTPTVEWAPGKELELLFSSFTKSNINNYIKRHGISKYSLENIIWNILGFLTELLLSIIIVAYVSTWLPDNCPSWINILIKCIGLILVSIMLIRNGLELTNFLFNSYPCANSWVYGKYRGNRVYMHPFWKFLIRIIRFFIPCPI